MHPNTAAALKAGRARWLARMREAKAAGLLTRLPNGRRPKGAAKLSADKKIARAQRIIEVVMTQSSGSSALAKPWAQMSKAEKLAAAADKGLDVAKAILDAPMDLDNTKLLALQQQTALTVIAQQIRVEQGKMSPSGPLPPEPAPTREITIVVSPEKAAGYDLAIERARRGE